MRLLLKTRAVKQQAKTSGQSILPMLFALANLVMTIGMMGFMFMAYMKDKRQATVEDLSLNGGSEEGDKSAPAAGDAAADHKNLTAEEIAELQKSEQKENIKDAAGSNVNALLDEQKKRVASFAKMVALEQFTINLSNPGTTVPRFVRVNVALSVENDDVELEVVAKTPQIRNIIIDLFNSRRPVDLSNMEGRDFIKEEIKMSVNNILVIGKVLGIFFTNFSISN